MNWRKKGYGFIGLYSNMNDDISNPATVYQGMAVVFRVEKPTTRLGGKDSGGVGEDDSLKMTSISSSLLVLVLRFHKTM
jgi:hypothetical protein